MLFRSPIGAADAGEGPGRLTGWLVEWPATTLLNVIYALLIEHANEEQIAEIEKALTASPDSGNPDELAAILERAIADDE